MYAESVTLNSTEFFFHLYVFSLFSYSTESEDIVRNLLNDLLVKVKEHHDQKCVENMVRSILTGILKCRSSEEIAHEILGNVSVNVTPEQKLSIEDASQKLYKIQDPDVSKTIIALWEV